MLVRYLIFFLLGLLVFGGSHYYVWARLVRDAALPAPWDRAATIGVLVLFIFLMSSFFVRNAPRAIAQPIVWFAFTWLGVLFFLVVSLAASDVGRVIALRVVDGSPSDPDRRLAISRMFAGLAAVLGVGASGLGVASVLGPVDVKRVKVAIDRLKQGFKIVQISDVHVGPTIGRGFVEDMVARINALDADVVAITGDLVDGSVAQLREHVEPLSRIKAKHGVFFVTGNHEYYSGADEWVAHLRSLGVRVLRNEHVSVGGEEGIDLAGIDDASAHTFGKGHGANLGKALAGRDAERACVLLAHQPRGIHEADRLGVDLQLSGHTHGGQLFPWGLLVRLQQPFVAGLHKLTRAHIYVSRGTGYWGPPMRVGAPAEITEIELVRPT